MALRKESYKSDYFSNIESVHIRLLLDLLEEYSNKLRYLYEEYSELQLSISTYANLFLVPLVFAGSGIGFFLLPNSYDHSSVSRVRVLIAALAIALVVIAAVSLWRRLSILRSRKRRLRLEIEVMSATLRRLIQRSSDVNEHVDIDLNERLALDARLAEAEGILKYSDISSMLHLTPSTASG